MIEQLKPLLPGLAGATLFTIVSKPKNWQEALITVGGGFCMSASGGPEFIVAHYNLAAQALTPLGFAFGFGGMMVAALAKLLVEKYAPSFAEKYLGTVLDKAPEKVEGE